LLCASRSNSSAAAAGYRGCWHASVALNDVAVCQFYIYASVFDCTGLLGQCYCHGHRDAKRTDEMLYVLRKLNSVYEQSTLDADMNMII